MQQSPRAIIFDMDGILIDSEPYWRQAEIEHFGSVGLELTEADCAQTTGLRIDEVVAYRYAEKPWNDVSQAEIAERILNRVEELVASVGVPLAGAIEAVNLVAVSGRPLALASSSSYRLIQATLKRLGLEEAFPVVHSAEEETWGKPHPAVYLQAAGKLGCSPLDCLAIEDSLNGVISAKAARMQVVAIPAAHDQNDPRFCLADHQLQQVSQLEEFLARFLA